jgi:probable phosphoglycerate mutase
MLGLIHDTPHRSMTTLLLVRHCAVDGLGRSLAGRAPGLRLNEAGRAHARRLAERFATVHLEAVFSSPLERALETADAFAPCAPGPIQSADDLLELDFGEWTGRSFEELAGDPRWASFNAHRSTTRIPGGELIVEVQRRAVDFLERVAARMPSAQVAVVTHGDVIRSAICYYLGSPLDLMQRFEIAPGSVSLLELGPGAPVVRALNAVGFDPHVAFADAANR